MWSGYGLPHAYFDKDTLYLDTVPAQIYERFWSGTQLRSGSMTTPGFRTDCYLDKS